MQALAVREAARRRADALGLLAERALAAGFGGGEEDEADDAPVSGSRAERYQVFLHVDRDTLSGHRSPEASGRGEPGRSELEDGTRVSAETSRRLSCDVGLVGVLRGEAGEVLDVGRRRRTVSPALQRALEAENRRRGADPGPRAASATWTGRRQVPDEIWYAALEAGFAAVDRAPP